MSAPTPVVPLPGIRWKVKHGVLTPLQALNELHELDPNASPRIVRWLHRQLRRSAAGKAVQRS